MDKRERVSAAIITFNEEQNLPRCLESLWWVDEIVIVDSGSTDRTVRIGEEAGARVHYRPWPGYAKQWENVIQLCSNPWILILEADTVVEQGLAGEMQEVLQSPGETRGYVVNYMHFFLGKWMEHCGWYPSPCLRLVRKDSVKVIHREVHESFTVVPYLVQELVGGHVRHYTYHSLHQYLEKFNRYTDLDALEMVKAKASFPEKDLASVISRKFEEMYTKREGFKDGLHGLVLCTLSAFYEFVKIAKYFELQRGFNNPGDRQ